MSEPLTLVDKAPEVRTLFSRFSQVNDPLVSGFARSIPEKFADAVDRVALQKFLANDFVLHNRFMLKSFIKKFHSEAGTLTDNVESCIDLLDNPTTKILVSTHQPNLFAYSGVFKKIVMLEALKRAVEERDALKCIVTHKYREKVAVFFSVVHEAVEVAEGVDHNIKADEAQEANDQHLGELTQDIAVDDGRHGGAVGGRRWMH